MTEELLAWLLLLGFKHEKANGNVIENWDLDGLILTYENTKYVWFPDVYSAKGQVTLEVDEIQQAIAKTLGLNDD